MHNYLRFLPYLRRQRASLLSILALTLAASALTTLQPWPLKWLIDHVLRSIPLSESMAYLFRVVSNEPSAATLLAVFVIAGLALFLFNAAVEGALTWLWTKAGRQMVCDLAEDLFAAYQSHSLQFHRRVPVADVMGCIATDSWCVYQLADSLIVTPLHALFTTAFMVALMMQLDVKLTWIAIAIALASVAASFLMGKSLRLTAQTKRQAEIALQAHVQQTLAGIPVVQAYGQEDREQSRFVSFATDAIRSHQRAALYGSLNGLSSGLIAAAGAGGVLWVAATHVVQGRLTIGSLFVFLAYLGSLQGQMRVLAGLHAKARNLAVSSDRVLKVLNAKPDVRDRPDALPLPSIGGEVEFKNVTVGYQSGKPVLRNVSFHVPRGKTVAVVGASGVGKTTLAHLIPRFADPWEGCVLIDGQDIRSVQVKSLRSQIAVVPQESFLFPISIAENIGYGKSGATQEEIEAAARAAEAHEFIMALSEGYKTILGERGSTLSGGERQRIAIARAWLRDPRILILDEPTSALDARTEQLIVTALRNVSAGRTTVIIAHRLSTIRNADSILVLKDGEVIENGTHEELLNRSGHYAHLHGIQSNAGLPVADTHQPPCA